MRNVVVTGCDARFVDGAITILHGFRRFHPETRRVCIVLPEEAEIVAHLLGDLAEVFPTPRSIRVVPSEMQSALLKLFTPLIDADVALWVDCDMVLCRPAPELWEVRGGEVLAVADVAYRVMDMIDPDLRNSFKLQYPEVAERPGFNGGLFSIRSDEWKDLAERYEEAFVAGEYPYHPRIWDQLMLNGLMHDKIRYLPGKFNAHNLWDRALPDDVRILHFTTSPKPWMNEFPKHEPAYYYWLRYGVGEDRFWPLAKSKLRIWARTPRRLISRFLKSRRMR